MIITIDGPSGAGKGTIGRYLAEHLGYAYLDTGLLYRELAFKIIQHQLELTDSIAIITLAQTITIEDPIDPELLRSEDIAHIASQVAPIPEVRAVLTKLQQEFCQKITQPYKGVVVDGRDIGTAVFPEAPCKLFITARPEVRVQRRLLDQRITTGKVQDILRERDQRDSQRAIAPLKIAPEALVIDTSDLSIIEACNQAAAHVATCWQDNSV